MNRFFAPLIGLLIYGTALASNPGVIPGKLKLAAPPMACNDLVHISLDTLCSATVAPHMLLEDMTGSPLDYRIKIYNANGTEQPDLQFNESDINKKYNFKIWHLPSGNSCWGQVLVEDKYAPVMLCRNYTLRCGADVNPAILGFPIPAAYPFKADSISPSEYEVSDWDACGLVYLSYRDYFYNNQCDSLCFKRIIREWTAIDEAGNTSYCTDTICFLRPTEDDLTLPHHYDDYDLPALNCDLNFPKLPNGHPSPDYTGWPVPAGCNTLTATFTDLKITTCGNTFKIVRRWVILNWCTSRITEFNQLIKVADHNAPVFKCPADFTVGMQLYTCGSLGKLPAPGPVIDCNTWTYDIFSMTQDPVTGLPHKKGKSFIFYDNSQQAFYLKGAPEGRIWIIYQVTDACGNVSECTMEIGVVDNLAPIPICDQKTVITLGIDGTAKAYAETFDDGSIDNCGIDSFKVRRMDDTCNTGTDVFGPFVRFCCADVGRTIMVALEVSDFYGNRNTCMIEALVQDKEPPLVIPPTDITVSCTYPIDFAKLSVFGSVRLKESDRKKIIIADPYYASSNFIAGLDGLAYDNCEFTLTETYEKDINCSVGEIRRIFVAKDKQGLTDTAVQTITIINTHGFDRDDIFWPAHREIYSCNNVVTHPDQTGYPTFTNTSCAQIISNYSDTKLIVLDSTCFKILRKWVVIDWCQYDRISNEGYWEYVQVIAVKNSAPPTITSCTDLDICDQTAFHNPNTGQCMASYQLTGSGFDDCSEPQDLIWGHRLDENNDGSFGPVNSGNIASGVLPIGTHRLRWVLTDQCGNISTCDQVFTLRDCKKPTPYCYNGVVTVIMPTTGSITVWAKDLNLGSFDNCTDTKDLKFSFSPDVLDVSVTYNCDSLNKQKVVTKVVRIYVTDEYGNQDYCETTIRIQDNNNACPGTNPGFNLSGKVRRENLDAISNATVLMNDPSGQLLEQQTTDQQGYYAFQNLKINNFILKPSKSDAINNGVSTLDLVLIQRHILGITPLASPYKMIAADVNNSNSITAKDVSDLRKVILGTIAQFPNQTPVWKFVKADYQFANPLKPWDAPAIIESYQLQEKLDQAHFMGIKTGDVDLSAKLNFGNPGELRDNSAIPWNYQLVRGRDDREWYIEISTPDPLELEGFQIELNWNAIPGVAIHGLQNNSIELQQEEYKLGDQSIRISKAFSATTKIGAGEVLFRIPVNGEFTKAENELGLHASGSFDNEIYSSDQVYKLTLRSKREIEKTKELISYPVQPNPFTETTRIIFEMPGSGVTGLQVYDLTGKCIYNKKFNGTGGKNEIELHKSDLPVSGLMYYVLTTPFGSASERMFAIE